MTIFFPNFNVLFKLLKVKVKYVVCQCIKVKTQFKKQYELSLRPVKIFTYSAHHFIHKDLQT